MKACERYLNAINELVDGTLGPLRRAELELHLESCDGCRGLLADLEEIEHTAQSLGTVQPPDGVWARIADRLRQEGRVSPPRRWAYRPAPAILAVAAALVIAVGASLFVLVSRDAATPDDPAGAGQHADTVASPDPDDPAQSIASELALTEIHLQNAIEYAKKSGTLMGTETAAVLQKNLQVVNAAIAESRAALTADPQNTPARESLHEALNQKIQFLQDTIALMNVMRQGDAGRAAELVEGGKS